MINTREFLQKEPRFEQQLLKQSDDSQLTPIINRGFYLPETLTKNSVLFVGINPSFNEKEGNKNLGFNFYPFDSSKLQDHDVFKNEIQYFRQMHRLLQYWTLSWSHLDIFCFRETNQNFVKELMGTEEGREFLKIQFTLFLELLNLVKPKVIIVCNALARDIMNYESNYGSTIGVNLAYKFDEDIGTPRITTEGPLKEIPIFFSSMLSGQRALDRGSFQRLGWHINYALNFKKK